MKTDKIYEQSKDLHVVANMIYVNDGKAYIDAAFEHQYKTSELKEVFVKGAMVQVAAGSVAFPVGYVEANSVGTISYFVSGTAATAVSVADE